MKDSSPLEVRCVGPIFPKCVLPPQRSRKVPDPQYRRIDDPRRDHAVAAQIGDEGLLMPFADRSVRPVALAIGDQPVHLVGQVLVDISSMTIRRGKALARKRLRRAIHSWRVAGLQRIVPLDVSIYIDFRVGAVEFRDSIRSLGGLYRIARSASSRPPGKEMRHSHGALVPVMISTCRLPDAPISHFVFRGPFLTPADAIFLYFGMAGSLRTARAPQRTPGCPISN